MNKRTKKQRNKRIKKQKNKKTKKQRNKRIKEQKGGNENKLIFIDNKIEKLNNKINNNYVYKIIINNCTYFFYIPETYSMDYGIIDDQYIINLNDNNNNNIIDEIVDYYNNENIKYSTKLRILKQQYHVYDLNTKCSELNNNLQKEINNAKQKIVECNEMLKQKCTNLSLKFDYLYNLNGTITSFKDNPNLLTLCLYNNDNYCVSSINVTIKKDYIEIASDTDEKYQNKKYNKLLRSVCILICSYFDKDKVVSFATNPISAWLMITYFNAVIDVNDDENHEYFEYIKNNRYNINDKKIFKETLIDFLQNDDDNMLTLSVILNNVNIKNAEAKFEETLNEISC